MNEKYLFLEAHPDHIELVSKDQWILRTVQRDRECIARYTI